MYQQRTFFSLVVIILLIVSLGCQGNPASPSTGDPAESLKNQSSTGNRINLGAYDIEINPLDMTIEAIPLRTGELHLNLTKIFLDTMNLGVVLDQGASDPPNGFFVVDFTLTHPFTTEIQFSIFDVKGIVMVPGSLAIGSLLFSDTNETQVLNADGYTRWWNPTEFTKAGIFGYTDGLFTNAESGQLTATVNPYKYFADILGPEDPMHLVYLEPLATNQGRGIFTPGSFVTRRYEVLFQMTPTPNFKFAFVIDGSWDVPVPNPPDVVPSDFPIEANQPEAYHVALAEKINTLYYDTETATGGGILKLQINVHDWQGQMAGDIENQIDAVRIFSPDLMGTGVTATFLDQNEFKARFTSDLYSLAVPTHAGQAQVVARVGSKGGPSYQQGPAPAPSADISAYQVITVDITDPECVGDANNSHLEAELVSFQDQVIGTLCSSVDSSDFYMFQIPPGNHIDGYIYLYSDVPTSELTLYDQDLNIIDGDTPSNGVVKLELVGWEPDPGWYYLEVSESSQPNPFLYQLSLDLELVDVTPSSPVDITPNNLDLDASWLTTHGDTAILTGPRGSWAYDTSDLYNPVFLSRIYDPVQVTPAEYDGKVYYWGGWLEDPAILNMVDYSNPSSPVLNESILSLPGKIEYITIDSEYMFIAFEDGVDSWIYIYDYTDPLDLQEIHHFKCTHYVIKLGIYDTDGPVTALIVMTSQDMRAYNVENPVSPVLKATYPAAPGTYNLDIAIVGNEILKTHIDGIPDGYVSSYTYLDLLGFSPKDVLPIPGYGYNIDAENNTAYIADNIGITVVDFSNLSSLAINSTLPTVSESCCILIDQGKLLNIPEHAGFSIYDASDTILLTETARVLCLNNPVDGRIRWDTGYFIESGGSYNAIKILDLTDPANPTIEGEILLNDSPMCMALYLGAHKILAVGTLDHKFSLYECTDLYNPVLAYSETFPSNVQSVAVTYWAAYAALSNGTLKVYNLATFPVVTTAPDPSWTSELHGLTLSTDLDYLYAYALDKVKIVDITSNLIPVYAGDFTSTATVRDIAIQNDYLYVCNNDYFETVELDGSGQPVTIWFTTLPYGPDMQFVAVEYQFAYVSDMGHNPVIVSVWPPEAPTVYSEPFGPNNYGLIMNLLVEDGIVYVMHIASGLRIYDLY